MAVTSKQYPDPNTMQNNSPNPMKKQPIRQIFYTLFRVQVLVVAHMMLGTGTLRPTASQGKYICRHVRLSLIGKGL